MAERGAVRYTGPVAAAASKDDYQFDAFDDGSWKLVGDIQLSKLRTFVQDYSERLRELEETLDESLSEVWDANTDPISLSLTPYEQTTVLELIKTDNKLFNKLIIVFSSLCLEIRELKTVAETKFIPALLLFGLQNPEAVTEGEAQVAIGRMLPFFLEFSNYVNRGYTVLQNAIRQLASLYHPSQKIYLTSFRAIHLQTVFSFIGELLVTFITLDSVIASNEMIATAWNMYKRMVKSIKSDPTRYQTSEERLVQFEKLLLSFEGQLLDNMIFQNAVEQEFDFPGLVEVRTNRTFQDEFQLNLQGLQQHLAGKLADEGAEELDTPKLYMELCALYVLYVALFRDASDTTFFKAVWGLHTQLPVVHLVGNVPWFPTDFLAKKLPGLLRAAIKNPASVAAFLKTHVREVDKGFEAVVQSYALQASLWMVRMESSLSNRAGLANILATRIMLIRRGLYLADRLGKLFKNSVDLHVALRSPIAKSQISRYMQCVELLKAIQNTFHRRSAVIGESLNFMVQQITLMLQRCVAPIKVRLESDKKYSDAKLDVLAAATLALGMLQGPPTRERRLVLRLALHALFQSAFLREAEVDEIRRQLVLLEQVCDAQDTIARLCDCAFLYWSKQMFGPYFQEVYAHPETAHRLQYFFAAVRDIARQFRSVVHDDPARLLQQYEREVEDVLRADILDKLCRDIEVDLRLHIHAHLHVAVRDPFHRGVSDLSPFVHLKPFRFFDRTISFKEYVSHYLDTTFYNLTTVALHDWKTYGEMRNLAAEKYGLELTDPHLPAQTLEQGLDILEIMRNIHVFVNRFKYNLNNQIFVEITSDSKTLNTINVSHVANSIRTHGTGTMNTTVNYTFQFLKQQFLVFSQFLYDDHIKSRLFKDIRFYKENKDKLNSRYPFERAEKFNKEIKKLGTTQDGLSFLGKFRLLITAIGNAMGYIRMIRSGGFYYTSNAIKFVPDLKAIVKFEELVAKESLSEETIVAARNLDAVVGTLSKNFAEGTAYFKLLVNVFATEFRNPNNAHLQNFYMIVPPLMINFIEAMLLAKDKLYKKGGKEGYFTDDGFALGVAYILKLLDQYAQFDSLHWFEAVAEHYRAQQEKLDAMLKKKPAKEDDRQTITLTIKKLESYSAEFRLLRFTFEGARIFFKD